MKAEDMTLKHVKECCNKNKTCDTCELFKFCSSDPCGWNLEGEVQDES